MPTTISIWPRENQIFDYTYVKSIKGWGHNGTKYYKNMFWDNSYQSGYNYVNEINTGYTTPITSSARKNWRAAIQIELPPDNEGKNRVYSNITLRFKKTDFGSGENYFRPINSYAVLTNIGIADYSDMDEVCETVDKFSECIVQEYVGTVGEEKVDDKLDNGIDKSLKTGNYDIISEAWSSKADGAIPNEHTKDDVYYIFNNLTLSSGIYTVYLIRKNRKTNTKYYHGRVFAMSTSYSKGSQSEGGYHRLNSAGTDHWNSWDGLYITATYSTDVKLNVKAKLNGKNSNISNCGSAEIKIGETTETIYENISRDVPYNSTVTLKKVTSNAGKKYKDSTWTSKITKDTTNYVNFISVYTITRYDSDGEVLGTSTRDFGQSVSVSSFGLPSKDYQTFSYWRGPNRNYGAGYSTQIGSHNDENANLDLVAVYSNNSYILRFNGNGHTSGNLSDISCTYGTSYKIQTGISKTGHTFKGWKVKDTEHVIQEGESFTPGHMPSKDNIANNIIYLDAEWETNIYHIKFEMGCNESHTADIKYQDDLPTEVPSENGCIMIKDYNKLSGWYCDPEFKVPATWDNIVNNSDSNYNITVYGKITPKFSMVVCENGEFKKITPVVYNSEDEKWYKIIPYYFKST